MKVTDLIEALEEVDPDLEVRIKDPDTSWHMRVLSADVATGILRIGGDGVEEKTYLLLGIEGYVDRDGYE